MDFKLSSVLACLILVSTNAFAQTVGNGITLTNYDIEGSNLTFDPTTVGTTATFDLLVTNLVGVTQEVVFSGVDAPFSLSESTLTLEAQAAQVITLSFNPSEVGDFVGELFFAGSIFGSGSLGISGEGTQIDIETNIDFVQFQNTAIGSSSTESLTITNAGSGTMLISQFEFSDSQFSVTEGALNIAEGASHELVITFTPVLAGGSSETLTIHSNDPNDPALVIDLAATGISEVSGELCGVWSAVNSPYILVDDVTVPDDCSLVIEAGVEVQGNGFDIIAYGPLQLLGEEENRISLTDLDLDMEAENADSLFMTHCDVEFVDIASSATGIPFEFDWNDIDYGVDGWYNSGGSGGSVSLQGGRVRSEYWSSNSNWRDIYFYSPNRNYSGGLSTLSFKREIDDYDGGGNGSEYWRFEVNIDGQGWQTLIEEYHIGDQPDELYELDLSDLSVSTTVQFRFHYHFYRGHYFYVDDFQMDLGEAQDFRSSLFLNDVVISKDFVMTGANMDLEGYNLRTKYVDWNQTESDYNIADWEVEGHAEKDEGAWFRGGFNNYHFSHITLNKDNWSNEQGLDFENVDYSTFYFDSCAFSGFTHGLYLRNSDYSEIYLNECVADSNTSHAFYFPTTTYSNFEISGMRARSNTGRGLQIDGSYNSADIAHSIFADNNNWGLGFECGTNSTQKDSLHIVNSGFFRNVGYGVRTSCQSEFEHLTILDNSSHGIYMDGTFHGMSQVLTSSVLWGNGANSSWDQLYVANNFINIAYTNLMGGGAGLAGGAWDLDGSFLSDMPYFDDNWGHMEPISPGVDGGKPWEMDAHMPMGLGGVRADMGMYGGPNNAYWGGGVIESGASSIEQVVDIPQDQGNTLGVTFDASHWDNSTAIDPVTSYSIWRHLDASGNAIATIEEGDWELVGEVPAQGFDSYGFQAPTLGNTNQFGAFNSCYTVIAQTALDQLYWQSNVMCGEAIDNLAPNAPQVNLEINDNDAVQIAWFAPEEEDYAYTEITSNLGFAIEFSADTIVEDLTVAPGNEVTYSIRHFDINGNASDFAIESIAVVGQTDVILLSPGWNLISLDRQPVSTDPSEVFSSLMPGNLQYVTGFEGGASIYDPNGLTFLNTLTEVNAGRGYWVKVNSSDELIVQGELLAEDYKMPLSNGWNLVGFAGQEVPISEYYEEEIQEGQLLYVTSFDGGSVVYDPNGLPFLNTLTSLENGFGYWVKVDLTNGLVSDNQSSLPSNIHDFVNGRTHDWLQGESILVSNEWGEVVSQIEVQPGGWMVSTPVYDIQQGSKVYFEWNGLRSAETIIFDGNRKLHGVKLDFELEAVQLFPNPASNHLSVVVDETEPSVVIIRDAAGREVTSLPWQEGSRKVIGVESLPEGHYSIEVKSDDGIRHSPFVIQR